MDWTNPDPDDIAFRRTMNELFIAPFIAHGNRIDADRVVDMAEEIAGRDGPKARQTHLNKLWHYLETYSNTRTPIRTYSLMEEAALEKKFEKPGAFEPFFKECLNANRQFVRALGAKNDY